MNMPTYVDASQFLVVEELVSDKDRNPFSHAAHRGTLTSEPDRSFFIKKMEDSVVANSEVLAQEFFRLIMPYQPETRTAELVEEVVVDGTTKEAHSYYVLSEEVKGYRALPATESVHFGDGTYTGLGQAVVCAMFLQEIDLKNGNIGLDERGRVVKIDGDWCFAPLNDDKFSRFSYAITPEGIESLPFPKGFYAFNWLDAIHQGTLKPVSRLIAPELSEAPLFRKEVNEAILMLCLLPDELIDRFVKSYAPRETQEKLLVLMKERLQQLRVSAARTPSFVDYLKTPEASEAKAKVIAQINAFKTYGTSLLSPEKQVALPRKIEEQEKQLMTLVVENECQKVLKRLRRSCDPADRMLHSFIVTNDASVQRGKGDLTRLKKIKAELDKMEKILNSSEVVAVKEAIRELREGVGLFTLGRNAKADRIQAALYRLPLEKRSTVISGPENPVQEALASHRLSFGVVYKKEGKIDEERATATFKALKSRFRTVASGGKESDADAPHKGE
jgi:hypothetical protein